MRLWTAGDIARELGLTSGSVRMWGMPNRRPVPEPYAVYGPQRSRLWTEEQARQIITEYRAEARARADREADMARGRAALERLVAS